MTEKLYFSGLERLLLRHDGRLRLRFQPEGDHAGPDGELYALPHRRPRPLPHVHARLLVRHERQPHQGHGQVHLEPPGQGAGRLLRHGITAARLGAEPDDHRGDAQDRQVRVQVEAGTLG